MTHPSTDLVRQFVERKLVPWRTFEAAMIVGSIAAGEARTDSDVDMVLVFDPLDVRVVPGEFAWSPTDDNFYPVVGPDAVEAGDIGGVQIDAKRLSVDYLESADLPEGLLHELAHGLLLFDRTTRVEALVQRRVDYPLERRRETAFRHRDRAWIHQAKAELRRRDRWTSRVGLAGAVDVLVGGLEEVILLVHACNGEFTPYRYRWLLSIDQLEWVPEGFKTFRDAVLAPPVSDPEERLAVACEAFDLVLSQVDDHFRQLGWARHAGEVWADSHLELGFGYNMDAWKRAHSELLTEAQPE